MQNTLFFNILSQSIKGLSKINFRNLTF